MEGEAQHVKPCYSEKVVALDLQVARISVNNLLADGKNPN